MSNTTGTLQNERTKPGKVDKPAKKELARGITQTSYSNRI